MPDFIPTPEQAAIVAAARDTTDNLMVIARAGAAKTSTLILIAEALPKVDILCLAFGGGIAEEMTERLPSNCESKTLHSLGYQAWRQFIPKQCKLVKNKMYLILKSLIEEVASPDAKAELYNDYTLITDAVSAAKQRGYLPESKRGHWKPLVDDANFWASLPVEYTSTLQSIVEAALIKSWDLALAGEIDFDDMIYCPAICSVSWPFFQLTLVDETQDLSPLNHHILKKMIKNRRLIAVGDPLQAIYGFRGASVNSMDELAAKFNTTNFYLTTSFRCGRLITENVHWIAPDMRSPDWAEDGEVLSPASWSHTEISDGDAIICRNNAPLFSLAIQLIENDRLPEIAGRDIAGPILKLMKKLGKPNLVKLAALEALNDWKERELRRARPGAKTLIYDKFAIMHLMIDRTPTLGDAQEYFQALVNRSGRIQLMTGHKSKGLEFTNVFFLDKQLCQLERGQDKNIRYVIETRAKSKLTYITTDGFLEGRE